MPEIISGISRDTLKVRHNARAVLLNQKQQLLLMKIDLPDRTFWCTIGGGIEEGETPESAVKREVLEETGFSADDVVWQKSIWYGEHVVPRDGIPLLNKETFILGYTLRENIDNQMLTEEEHQVVKGFKWWSLEEMEATEEFIVPPSLLEHIKPILNGDLPQKPATIDLSGAPPKIIRLG